MQISGIYITSNGDKREFDTEVETIEEFKDYLVHLGNFNHAIDFMSIDDFNVPDDLINDFENVVKEAIEEIALLKQ